VGLLLGALTILAIRFVTYDAGHVHYHANFAVYINGKREEFKGSTYYEEVTACKASEQMTPEDRVHMHGNINDVVHVHDSAVTWGAFFENLGWSVGKEFIHNRDVLYQNNGKNILHINLNDQDLTGISSISDKVIGDEDRLLLSFGDISGEELKKEFQSITSLAHAQNVKPDPASCSGANGTTLSERLRNLF